jgi:hypothetical protein
MHARYLSLAVAALALAACGSEEGQGGLTAEEERQLDEAARMLDENVIDASPDSLVANEAELEAMEAPEGSGAAEAVENVQ